MKWMRGIVISMVKITKMYCNTTCGDCTGSGRGSNSDKIISPLKKHCRITNEHHMYIT